jgi:hypothetical protein
VYHLRLCLVTQNFASGVKESVTLPPGFFLKVPPESIGCPLAAPMQWWYLRGGRETCLHSVKLYKRNKKVCSPTNLTLATPGGRAVEGVGLKTLDCWHRGFESR